MYKRQGKNSVNENGEETFGLLCFAEIREFSGQLDSEMEKVEMCIRDRYVLEHFAKDVLGDDYEAVFAVHTDREHMHGHLIWNSVSAGSYTHLLR